VWKTTEVRFGTEDKKLKELASLSLACDKSSFREVIKKLAVPKVIVQIDIGNHAIHVYRTLKGISCYDCNEKQWILLQDLDKWLERMADKYGCDPRFLVRIQVSSFTYEGDYSSEVGINDLLKDQEPNELVRCGNLIKCLFEYALLWGSITSLQYFLVYRERKKIKFLTDKDGISKRLLYAIMYDHRNVVELLANMGIINLNKKNRGEYIPGCYKEVIGRLAKVEIDVNQTFQFWGYSPLEVAAIICGSPVMIETLVKAGAKTINPFFPLWTTSNDSILGETIFAGHTAAALKLLDLEPRYACLVNHYKITAFMAAAFCNNLIVMERLMGMGVDIHQKDKNDCDAFDYAVGGRAEQAIDFLKAKEFTVDSMAKLKRTSGGSEPRLIFVVRKLNVSILRDFLNDPLIDVDAKDSRGHPALYYALTDKDSRLGLQIIKLLLERGCADVDAVKDIFAEDSSRRKIFEDTKICIEHFKEGVELLLKANKDSCFFSSVTFNDKFLLAQKEYPAYFEALLFKLLHYPQIFFKKLNISNVELRRDIFKRLLDWCNDNCKSFKYNASLFLQLGQLSYEGKYIKPEGATHLLENAQVLESDLPTWKRKLCVKLLANLKTENEEARAHLSQSQKQDEVVSDQVQVSSMQ
jgi:hypothetical protein